MSNDEPGEKRPSPRARGFLSRAADTVRAFAESAELRALNDALPVGFAALVLAMLAILFSEPHGWQLWPQLHLPLGAIAAAMLPAFGAMAIVTMLALAVRLAERLALPVVPQLLLTAAAFALAAVPSHATSGVLATLREIGASGLLLAILIAMYCAQIARASRTLPLVGRIAVLALALAPFGALRYAGLRLEDGIAMLLAPLAHLGDSYPALLVIVAVETALWCVGIHGPALLAGVVTPVYLSLQASNSLAFAAHQALPHIVVVSLFLFIFPGGAGATMPLALMLAFSKVPRLRRIGRACVPFALINANEPLLLSLPIVMNPYLAVPFVLAPMLLATTTYACVALGWVARAAFYIPSSIPAPISVYLATLDWRAPLLLLVNLAIAAAIWRPFVQAYERAESRLA